MTEKRFNVFDVDGTVFLEDHKEGSYHIGEKENVDIPCLNDIADRLNTYADENEQLKKDNKEYIRGLDLSKATSQSWASDVRELREQNCQLEKENEQLKKQIERIDFILDDLNGAEYISRDDGIKALNKIDKVIGKR